MAGGEQRGGDRMMAVELARALADARTRDLVSAAEQSRRVATAVEDLRSQSRTLRPPSTTRR
jgi:hypothetical protein